MEIVLSRTDVPIRLTSERWQHIVVGHPEMSTIRGWVLETVAEPDMVQEGDFGALLAIRHYPKTPLTSKHLVVAYRVVSPVDGFVITAYLTGLPAKMRRILWKR